jgi:hypothetical protein
VTSLGTTVTHSSGVALGRLADDHPGGNGDGWDRPARRLILGQTGMSPLLACPCLIEVLVAGVGHGGCSALILEPGGNKLPSSHTPPTRSLSSRGPSDLVRMFSQVKRIRDHPQRCAAFVRPGTPRWTTDQVWRMDSDDRLINQMAATRYPSDVRTLSPGAFGFSSVWALLKGSSVHCSITWGLGVPCCG